jgi:hypothetical protein
MPVSFADLRSSKRWVMRAPLDETAKESASADMVVVFKDGEKRGMRISGVN